MVDKIIQGKTRTRREFCSFYTESDPILTYMVNRLGVFNYDLILEPCAGDGIFIEKIFELNKQKSFRIEAMDLNPKAVENLKQKFIGHDINIRQTDTLLDLTLDLVSNCGGRYTKIIGNPPYGAWQEYKKRNILKKHYGGYVKETYTLFLSRCLDLLKIDGRLVFIIPDTFLALHLHKGIRKKILENTEIEEILLIPSNFFPGVNFGYSNLCIISFVKKRKPDGSHKINIVSVKNSINNLYKISERDYLVADSFESISQKRILDSIDYSFLIGGNTQIRNLVNDPKLTLGDIADCVTGFYSGNNKKFLFVKDKSVKGAKEYQVVDNALIKEDFKGKRNLLDGLENKKIYLPILKGSGTPFIRDTEWFVRWDKRTVKFYKEHKASRFQNSQYYFKEGIGVPMIKTKQIRAFLLGKKLFDQSIVGIFPKSNKHLNFLLAFLNSNTCSRILNVINHTANNSANYLKKLPIILNDSVVVESNQIIGNYKKNKDVKKTLDQINNLFDPLYKI